jgi:TatD DNase family protein
MQFSDTHCHIYTEQFSVDRDQVLRRAQKQGVKRFFLPNIDLESVDAMLEICEDYGNAFPMIGLHPCSVNNEVKSDLNKTRRILYDNPEKFIAVGEMGLDLYWDKSYLKEQERAFREQVYWAKDLGKPIVIHVRDAFQEVFRLMDELYDESLTGVFHCFTGGVSEVEKIKEYANFFFGIGGVLTFKNSGLDKTLSHIPMDRIVLETDSPYLAPSPFRGKRNEPGYVRIIAQKMSEITGKSLEELSEITEANTNKLFQL